MSSLKWDYIFSMFYYETENLVITIKFSLKLSSSSLINFIFLQSYRIFFVDSI